MKKQAPTAGANGWLEQAFPEIPFMLNALDGDESALDWLKQNSEGVNTLTRALLGRRKALGTLHNAEPGNLDDLFGIVENEDLSTWLAGRRPELHLLFEGIKGNPGATRELKRTLPKVARLAGVMHDLYETFRQRRLEEGSDFNGETVSEMGCLIGEMHLKAGEYDKAVIAFSRAIASKPEADLYEGRARAYRGLAETDERRAADLRLRG